MKRVHCIFLGGERIIPLLYPNKGFSPSTNTLFMDTVFSGFTDPVVEIVERPEDADYLLIPHSYQSVKDNEQYLRSYTDMSTRTGKKIVTFWYGDSDEIVTLPNAIVLRTSQYRYKLQPNEIMMPAYSEDLLGGRPLTFRPKNAKSTIGFCGWSKPRDMKNLIGTTVKNAIVRMRALGDSRKLSELKGITLRAKALDTLRGSSDVVCNFIERSSYSGHGKTIQMDPAESRKQFIGNIEHSDFVLCAKGDGNFSYRFYETLSMGRIPLFLDTDCILPLEDRIEYDRIVCRVTLQELPRIGEIAAAWYGRLTEDEWKGRQQEARKVFEEHLSAPVFFRRLFRDIL